MGDTVEILKFLWVPVMGVFSYFYVNSEKAKKSEVDVLKVDLEKVEERGIVDGKEIAVLKSKQLDRNDVEKIIQDKVGPLNHQLHELREAQKKSSDQMLDTQRQIMELIMKKGDRRGN